MIKNENSNKIINKLQSSCASTFKEVMLCWFIPLQKISGNSVIYKEFKKNNNILRVSNDFGTTEIRNRLLCEYHVSILVAIIKHSKLKHIEDGSIIAIFKEIDVMREIGIGEKNYARFRELIKEIGDAQYYHSVGNRTKRVSILKDHILINESRVKIEGVVFHQDYVGVNKNDFSIDFKDINEKIYKIPYSTIPTIIKYIYYSFNNLGIVNFKLLDVLKAIGFPVNAISSVKTIKSNLSDFSAKLKEDFGITYEATTKTFIINSEIKLKSISEDAKSINETKKFIDKTIIYKGFKYIITKIEKNDENWNIYIKNSAEEEVVNFTFLDDLIYYLEYAKSGNSINTLL